MPSRHLLQTVAFIVSVPLLLELAMRIVRPPDKKVPKSRSTTEVEHGRLEPGGGHRLALAAKPRHVSAHCQAWKCATQDKCLMYPVVA